MTFFHLYLLSIKSFLLETQTYMRLYWSGAPILVTSVHAFPAASMEQHHPGRECHLSSQTGGLMDEQSEEVA